MLDADLINFVGIFKTHFSFWFKFKVSAWTLVITVEISWWGKIMQLIIDTLFIFLHFLSVHTYLDWSTDIVNSLTLVITIKLKFNNYDKSKHQDKVKMIILFLCIVKTKNLENFCNTPFLAFRRQVVTSSVNHHVWSISYLALALTMVIEDYYYY